MKYVCNDLYRHLIPEQYHDRILFLSNAECEAQGRKYDLSETEGMICQPFYVNKPFLDRMPGLRWVQITGAGYERADTEELKKRGIVLANARGVMSISIAEDVFAKMLFFAREIRRIEADKKSRIWDMFGQDQWMCTCYGDLYQKKLGIMGFGSIGREVAVRARAFGMGVYAYGERRKEDPLIEKSYAGQAELTDFYRNCDYIVLSLPLTAQTRYLVDETAFAAMKNTAVLINVSRGPVVKTEALLSALERGEIRGAALDVFEEEPLPPDSRLWGSPRLFLTPHKAGMGDSWTERLGALICRNIDHYEAGEKLENQIPL